MDEQEWLAQRFEEHRSRLRAVAYRMLGSLSEADDAVQDTWIRLSRIDADEVENLGGWLTTVVARVCLNMLRSRQSRREEPFGPHVPEPIIDPVAGVDPEHEALLADSVGLALLVVLETLAPAERLAFVLHDMFAVPFDQIAPIVDRSPEAARQLASRARRRVRGSAPVGDADLDQQRAVVEAFLAAAREGDFDALLAVLDPDVVLRADSGPGLPGATVEVRPPGPGQPGGPDQRRLRHGRLPQRRAVLGGRGDRQGRPDRRDGHPGRPRTATPARPAGSGRLRAGARRAHC